MRKKQEISSETLAFLEEQFRSYPQIGFLKAVAEKRDANKSMEYYDTLEKDINNAFECLSEDLQEIVEECFWGKNRHLDWETIGAVYLGVKRRKSYEVRYQILEELALKQGLLIR